MSVSSLLSSLLYLASITLSPAQADDGSGADAYADGPTCAPDSDALDDHALLRAWSLDVRGVVPSPEEYAAFADGASGADNAGDGGPDVAALDAWLQTDEFAWRVVRYHRSLLWPNVTDIRLLSNRQRLLMGDDGIYYRYLVAPNYRGGPVSCGDFEAQYDADGELILQETEEGYRQEGWVWVTPYWDRANPIRVCAYEAQEAVVSPWGTACDTYDGRYDMYCGCGPELAWCDTFDLGHNGDNPEPPVAMGIAGDIEHRIHRVIDEDLSYLEILTGRTMFVNGPYAHFLRYQTQVPAHVRFNEIPIDPDLLPDLAFEDEDTWVPVELGEEQSGVLTSTAYLMKFQTRRGRANRFYSAFLCQPFQPPDQGLQDLNDPDASLDLTQRSGCSYCHAILEPAGSHWGRWVEYGAGWLDPDHFGAFEEDCEWCAITGESCSPECLNYYVTDPLTSEEDPWLGSMRSYEFVEERHLENIAEGPKLLVNNAVADGRLPACVAKNAATWLLGREVDDNDAAWLDGLTREFIASDYRYPVLVRSILTSDAYRSAR